MRGEEAREEDGEWEGRDGEGFGKKEKISEISYGSRLVQPSRKMSEGGSGWVGVPKTTTQGR